MKKIVVYAVLLISILAITGCQKQDNPFKLQKNEEVAAVDKKQELMSLIQGRWIEEYNEVPSWIEVKGEKFIDSSEGAADIGRDGVITAVTQTNGSIYEVTIYYPEWRPYGDQNPWAEKQVTVNISSADDYTKSFLLTTSGTQRNYKREEFAVQPETIVPETQPQQSEPAVSGDSYSDDYLFPSDMALITEADLYGKSQYEVELILNEIYARHGYIFKKEKFSTYFGSKAWYVPNANYSDSMLNNIERENIDFIVQFQKNMGWRA